MSIDVSDSAHELVRHAARVWGVSEAAALARAVYAFPSREDAEPESKPERATSPESAPVEALYRGQRFSGSFARSRGRLRVHPVPELGFAGGTFASPSAAALACIRATNRQRNRGVDGWLFWRLTATGAQITVLRMEPKARAIPAYTVWNGHRVTGSFDPATGRMRLTSGAAKDSVYRTPRGALIAWLATCGLSSDAAEAQIEAGTFWRDGRTHRVLRWHIACVTPPTLKPTTLKGESPCK